MNRYGIPEGALSSIRLRDRQCVYCHKPMVDPSAGGWRGDWATIEHLNCDPPFDDPSTVAICCGSCNSSRGAKAIRDWLAGAYCRERGITLQTVSPVVRAYVESAEQ